MIAGDPHVKVKVPGQEAICFDISEADMAILDLLSNPTSGLEVNGQIVQEGHNSRLERIFIKTPRDVEIGLYPDHVTVGTNGQVHSTYQYDQTIGFGSDDVHVDIFRYFQKVQFYRIYLRKRYCRTQDITIIPICSHNDGSRKNNAIITLPGDDVDMETKFHVSIKNGKNSMKFEIVDSRGLAGAKLTGIIGHSILPNDYQIDSDGVIHVGGRLVNAKAEWNEHELCHNIGPELVPVFLGHNVVDYELENKFDRFRPALLQQEKSPK